jgi:hypothetical protein
MSKKIEQAVLDAIVKAAVKRMMDDEERKNYDMQHPYWREELREYMEKRGVQKQPVEVASTGQKEGE